MTLRCLKYHLICHFTTVVIYLQLVYDIHSINFMQYNDIINVLLTNVLVATYTKIIFLILKVDYVIYQ